MRVSNVTVLKDSWDLSIVEEEEWQVDKENRTLEEIVGLGQTSYDWDANDPRKHYYHFNIYRGPEWMRRLIKFGLRGKHETLGSPSSVVRFLVKSGVIRINRLGIDILLMKRKGEICERGPEDGGMLDLNPFSYKCRASRKTSGSIKASVFWWAGDALNRQADAYGVSVSQMAAMAMIFGVASSVSWVPAWARDIASEEVDNFISWAENLVEEIGA
jgi:hypothetical protein